MPSKLIIFVLSPDESRTEKTINAKINSIKTSKESLGKLLRKVQKQFYFYIFITLKDSVKYNCLLPK